MSDKFKIDFHNGKVFKATYNEKWDLYQFKTETGKEHAVNERFIENIGGTITKIEDTKPAERVIYLSRGHRVVPALAQVEDYIHELYASNGGPYDFKLTVEALKEGES